MKVVEFDKNKPEPEDTSLKAHFNSINEQFADYMDDSAATTLVITDFADGPPHFAASNWENLYEMIGLLETVKQSIIMMGMGFDE